MHGNHPPDAPPAESAEPGSPAPPSPGTGSNARGERPDRLTAVATLGAYFLCIGALYWGRMVLMPLALAILFAFLLSPVVTRLRGWGMRHTFAVTVVVCLAFTVLGAVLFGIGQQFNRLAIELPEYQDNIRQKIRDLRQVFQNASFGRTRRMLHELQGELNGTQAATNAVAGTPTNGVSVPSPENVQRVGAGVAVTAPAPATNPGSTADSSSPPPVPASREFLAGQAGPFTRLLGPVANLLATAGLVIALVVFMLLHRDEVRNRLILLGGLERLTVTTRVVREAGDRITRYLIAYTLLNAIYGVAIAVGLYLIGLPYAFLWGVFAGVVRFIPYLGPWLGALLPGALALAVFPGWVQPLLVVGLYTAVELTSNMVLEPAFYGHSAGVSEVALLVALAFWTWIWGPIGLILGTPMTVCLVVIAKYIPALETLHLLFGDGPVEEKCLIYYERLCAHNEAEADVIVRDHLRETSPLQLFDDLLLPVLVFAKRDREAGKLNVETNDSILANVRKSVEAVEAAARAAARPNRPARRSPRRVVLGLAGGKDHEGLALLMFRRVLEDSGVTLEILPADLPLADAAGSVPGKNPDGVCVGTLPPHGKSDAERVVAQLREAGYRGPVVVGRWGISRHLDRRLARALGPEYVGSRFARTRRTMLRQLHAARRSRGRLAEILSRAPGA